MNDRGFRAFVQQDYMGGLKIAVSNDRVVYTWPEHLTVEAVQEAMEATGNPWLRISEAPARALYEALADHFGHGSNDVRALRRDYEAERARVDKLIANLVGVKP
jgi:hypothetical protein